MNIDENRGAAEHTVQCILDVYKATGHDIAVIIKIFLQYGARRKVPLPVTDQNRRRILAAIRREQSLYDKSPARYRRGLCRELEAAQAGR